MTVTRDQAQMLATLASDCRPHGATPWDAAGIMAKVGEVKHLTLADVILAVIRAADDRDAKTPGVITAPASTYWRERGTRPANREPYDAGGTCSTCSLPHDRCRQVWAGDHEYVSVAGHARTVDGDPDRSRAIVESLKAEKALLAESRRAVRAALDHAGCEDAINVELAAGKNGRAEYLATRCDIAHGDQDADRDARAAMTTTTEGTA